MASISKTKLFKCPYCDKKFNKIDLVDHVNDDHDDLIPENYSALRVVYDYINCKPAGYEGKCVICGKPSHWNEAKGKYNRLCDNKACKKAYIKLHSNPGLKSTEIQAVLLAKRKISGTYVMADGAEKTYTGSYEKKCLEFLDKIIKVRSEDIQATGVVLEYEYEGQKHMYLSDFYYAPYNLIIEVKDGGDNPNRREMIEYRNKTTAKEKYIINETKYNYIRLTNNEFSQLLTIFFELKMIYLDENSTERIIRINE